MLFDGQGNYLGSIEVLTDITEPKRVEEELKQSEENYRSIFENVQEGIFRSTLDGRITLCNQALATMFGLRIPRRDADQRNRPAPSTLRES